MSLVSSHFVHGQLETKRSMHACMHASLWCMLSVDLRAGESLSATTISSVKLSTNMFLQVVSKYSRLLTPQFYFIFFPFAPRNVVSWFGYAYLCYQTMRLLKLSTGSSLWKDEKEASLH